jgi:molecular chaperone DnaK
VVSTHVSLPFISATQDGPVHLEMDLTRAKFDELTADLVEKTVGPFNQALQDSKIDIGKIDEVVLVGGATRMPSIQELVRRLARKDPHKGVNPDEVVAVGAAIQAGVLTGAMRDIVLLDVTPLSLGIETLGGVMTVLIPRNTTIPLTRSETFSTAEDAQTAVDVHVFQGERSRARENKKLGDFRLDGIPPAPRGIPQIEVTFDIDANGIVNVSAKDKGTGKEQHITITSTGALSSEEIEQMVRAAEQHAEDDRKFREAAEVRNKADHLAYQVEKMLKEHGDKLPAAEKANVERAVSDVREALTEGDTERIRRASEALEQASYKLSEVLYQQTTAEAGPQAGPTPEPGGPRPAEDDVIDAEFRAGDEK